MLVKIGTPQFAELSATRTFTTSQVENSQIPEHFQLRKLRTYEYNFKFHEFVPQTGCRNTPLAVFLRLISW